MLKSFLSFKLGTGEVEDICYEVNGDNSGVFLSRLGVMRLLTTIEKSCEQFCLRENWKERLPLMKGNQTKKMDRNNRPLTNEGYHNVTGQRNIGRRQNLENNYRRFEGRRRHVREVSNFINRNIIHSNKDAIETVRSVFNNERGRGCFNCGELNHRANTCRFDHRLRCGNCNGLGHKSRLCHFFNR